MAELENAIVSKVGLSEKDRYAMKTIIDSADEGVLTVELQQGEMVC